MKFKLIALSQRYAVALSRHLKQGANASLRPALRLGGQAAALGLGTLALARVHEPALATLGLTHIKNAFTKLAGKIFAVASTLIEETHGITSGIVGTQKVAASSARAVRRMARELRLQQPAVSMRRD